MKNLMMSIAGCIAVAVCVSFTQTETNPKSLANVNRIDGYYVFVQCKPVAAYEELGKVKKTGIVLTGDPEEMFRTLVKRTKKDFPKADGIIFDDVAMEHATCIEFK